MTTARLFERPQPVPNIHEADFLEWMTEMIDRLTRRDFLRTGGAATAAVAFVDLTACAARGAMVGQQQLPYKISLAQWSLYRTINAGQLDHLEFARVARQEFDIDAIEYVNVFFFDKAKDQSYLAELNRRAADQGVLQHLIRENRPHHRDSGSMTSVQTIS